MSTAERACVALCTFCLLASTAACSGGTRQANEVETAGFLSDYDKLAPDPSAGVQLRYRNPEAVLESYEAVLIEPVRVWNTPQTAKLSARDSEHLANRLYSLLYVRLSRDFHVVEEPGPRTIRVAVALTGAERSRPVLDTVSTVVPVGLVLSGLQELATGTPSFVGEASAEARLTDAQSGDLLLESVDRRVGRKGLQGVARSWDDVDRAFVYWADRLGYSLCAERRESNCVAP